MIAVSGHVVRPGVYEIVNGSTTFRDLLYGDDFAQGIRDGNELKCFVPGGGSAPWFLPDQLDIPFEGPQAGAAGSMLGSGAVMVMDSTTDIPAAALTLVKFYAHESCGKCVPCREGGTWLYRIVERIVAGNGTDADLQTILEVGADDLSGRHAPRVERTARAERGAVPVQDDHDLLRRPVGVRADPLGAHAVPRGLRRAREPARRTPHDPGAGGGGGDGMSDTPRRPRPTVRTRGRRLDDTDVQTDLIVTDEGSASDESEGGAASEAEASPTSQSRGRT